MKHHGNYAIIGGGIGGLTLAIALQRKGFDVTVYEQAPEIKALGAGLALAGNALLALKHVGLDEEIINASQILEQVSIKNQKGKILTATDAAVVAKKYGVPGNFTIHRADLHQILFQQLKPGTVVTGKQCIHVHQYRNEVTLQFADGVTQQAHAAIACDGIHSPIRRQLILTSTPRYAGYTCWRAVVYNPDMHFHYRETSETWGPGKRFGIVPLTNNRIYWFACINAPAQSLKMKNYSLADLQREFQDFHEPVGMLLKHTDPQELIWGDIMDIKPINQFAFGNIVLMGDAAHATTPNMGQGACMALEDAAILASCIEAHQETSSAFQAFEQKRITRTTKIVTGSYTLGKLAQLENPLLSSIRDLVLQVTPASVAAQQIKFLYDISFG